MEVTHDIEGFGGRVGGRVGDNNGVSVGSWCVIEVHFVIKIIIDIMQIGVRAGRSQGGCGAVAKGYGGYGCWGGRVMLVLCRRAGRDVVMGTMVGVGVAGQILVIFCRNRMVVGSVDGGRVREEDVGVRMGIGRVWRVSFAIRGVSHGRRSVFSDSSR